MSSQYLMILVYLLALGVLGVLASRKLKNPDDFSNGGKRLGFWVTALSTQATGKSAWLLLGLTGLGAMVGVSALWVVVGEFLGVGFVWFFMAKRFRDSAEQCNAVTTTDYLVNRFPKQASTIRCLSVISLVFFCTIYAAAEIDATGEVLENSLGWNYYLGALAGFLIVYFIYRLCGSAYRYIGAMPLYCCKPASQRGAWRWRTKCFTHTDRRFIAFGVIRVLYDGYSCCYYVYLFFLVITGS